MNQKVFILVASLAKGGAERVVSILANNLYERGFNVSILLLRESNYAYDINENIGIIPLTTGKRTVSIFNRISYASTTFRTFYRLAKEESPAHVISFTTSANIWTAIVCNLLRIPYTVSERTTPERTVNSYNPLLRKVVFELYKRSRALVVPSQGIQNKLQENAQFSKLTNIKLINNPISEFGQSSTSKVHTKKFILSVGRLNRVKGFDRLIDAYKMAGRNDVDLIIVGDGVERDDLTRQIKSLGLEGRVFLPGRRDNVQDYYKQCELFLLTSRNEGYPNVLIEAMAAGCPCVAFDCEFGPNEIIQNGENGILVPNNNVPKLAESINAVLDNQELRLKISKNATGILKSNSTQVFVREWEKLIENYV